MILVFGKTGQVGNELSKFDCVTALGRNDVDLFNPAGCAAEILLRRPSAVINAAAYTAVDKAEDEEELATIINGETPGAMARVCAELAIPFLHVSTDYVFAGVGQRAWIETDTCEPLNAYGRSKLAGEKAILSAEGNSAIVRTSWVFSAQGSNFAKTMLALAGKHEALNVVADQIGGPTPARAIADALMVMGSNMANDNCSGVYHFAGAPDVSWADFASEIFKQSGADVTVNGIPTVEYLTPAKRPHNSRMDCTKIYRDFGIERPNWKVGLSEVLAELGEIGS